MNKIVERTVINKQNPWKTRVSIRFRGEFDSNEIDEMC
jgi:hypothetical protein